MSSDPVFGEIIHSYSRREAIEDGVLIDLMQDEDGKMARSLGFRFDIAMTPAAYETAIFPSSGSLPPGQDRGGRLWDVLWMLKFAIKRSRGDGDALHFNLSVANFKDGRAVQELLTLKALCGPGDDAEPVITIMLPDED
jgi:hypothetical protein